MGAGPFREHTFQDNVSAAAADGAEVSLNQAGLVVVQIKPTTFTGTVVFEVKHERADAWIPIAGRKLSDWTTLESTVTNPAAAAGYRLDVRGFGYFRARITRTAGSVSVWGSVVNANP